MLIAGTDFGTGSSREHAVWALRDWGIRVVLAESFGDIFRRNAWKNGLLAVPLKKDVLDNLMNQGESSAEFTVTVDLVDCVVDADGAQYRFDVDPRDRMLVLNAIDEIDATLSNDTAIRAHEGRRAAWLPTFTSVVSD